MTEHRKQSDNVHLKKTIQSVFRDIKRIQGKGSLVGYRPGPDPRWMSVSAFPLPNGGWITCDFDACLEMLKIVEDYMLNTKAGREVELYSVFHAFKKEISNRFMEQTQLINSTRIKHALAQAVVEAKKEWKTITHWIPCHLVANDEPAALNIGPVTFRRTSRLMQSSQLDFERYIEEFASDPVRDSSRDDDSYGAERKRKGKDLVDRAQGYYERFDWVAEVTISELPPRLSARRARLCVQAALDIFRLRFGRSYGQCIDAEGSGMLATDSARITKIGSSELNISVFQPLTTVSLTEDCWSELINALSQDGQNFIGKLLQTLTKCDGPPHLCQRLLDALNWFGQAVREVSPGAAIMKFVTSIERLTQCGDKDPDYSVTKQFCGRAAALSVYPESTDFRNQYKKFHKLYDLRSKIAHGSISPLDSSVEIEIELTEKLTKMVIIGAFKFFEVLDAYSMKWNAENLNEEMKRLVQKAQPIRSKTDL